MNKTQRSQVAQIRFLTSCYHKLSSDGVGRFLNQHRIEFDVQVLANGLSLAQMKLLQDGCLISKANVRSLDVIIVLYDKT